MSRTRIAVITSTRADWGLLSAPARALRAHKDVDLMIVAGNMHLSAAHGHTVDEITAQGFDIAATVPLDIDGDTPAERALAMAQALERTTYALSQLHPDRIVLLGDRYEILAAACSAAMLGIPIVHMHGGEITRGAIDDAMRHAITKLSSLHLASTEQHRRRIIQMGEDPATVINTGAIGVYNIMNTPVLSEEELAVALGGFRVGKDDTLLVTYHPATLTTTGFSVKEAFGEFLKALDRRPALRVVFTGANNDAGGNVIREMTRQWVGRNSGRAIAVANLGMQRYLSAMKYCGAVAGNSSSGIIEAPSMHVPTVDIGPRQMGRTAARSVIHCGESAAEIVSALDMALSEHGRKMALDSRNPYYRPDTLKLITDAILHMCPSVTAKTFYDIPLTPRLS